MKIYNKLFIYCLFICAISSQQTYVSAQTAEEAAQAEKLNVMVRAAFKELKPCLGDAIRILKFIKNNSKIMDKIPTILEKVQTKINNNDCMCSFSTLEKAQSPTTFKLKSTCHMYDSKTTAIPEATQLLQTIQEKSIANVLIDTLTTMSQIVSKLSHALAETADIINHVVDLIKLFNNQNADILKEVLEQTLDKTELQSLNDFIQSETPQRLCKAIENKPSSCLELTKELLTQYKKDIFIVKSKLIEVNAKLSKRTKTMPKAAAPATMTTIKTTKTR